MRLSLAALLLVVAALVAINALLDGVFVRAQTGIDKSPIIIDVSGHGFSLTDAQNGVNFDLNADGNRERLGWTMADSDNAFLFLDRNDNGIVDNGTELFGDETAQPKPPKDILPNGFNALAMYDKPDWGGNGDGIIDSHDAVF